MIPNYQQFMRPFLQIANDANGNEVKLRNVINQLADQFGLTDEERSETLPSGRQSILDNRVGWARTYLTKAGLLEATRRAHFVITSRGKEALSEDVDINNEYLKKFDEFIVFKQKSNDGVGTENNSDNIEHEELSTPDEILRAAYKKVNEALAQDILERTRKVTPDFFEDLLIELLIAMGYGGAGEGAAHALGKTGRQWRGWRY